MRKRMLLTMLALVALLPGSAQANHASTHGPTFNTAASGNLGQVNCATVQAPLAIKGASETFIPPAVTSVTLTSLVDSECNLSLPSLSEIKVSLYLYRETPKFSGNLTFLGSSLPPACTNCFSKTATFPDTTVTVVPDSRYILYTRHDWKLRSGAWSVFGQFCWGNSATEGVCQSFADLIVS